MGIEQTIKREPCKGRKKRNSNFFRPSGALDSLLARFPMTCVTGYILRPFQGLRLLLAMLALFPAQVFIDGLFVAFGCAGSSAGVARLALAAAAAPLRAGLAPAIFLLVAFFFRHYVAPLSYALAARPEGCPSVLTTSPTSITCLKRRRSSSICWSGFSPKRRATAAPSAPPGGSYLSVTRTVVPRSPAAGSKRTLPALSTSAPSSERQAINSFSFSL